MTDRYAIPEDLSIPPFLKVDAAEAKRRAAYWEKNPPKPMPVFGQTADEVERERRRKVMAEIARDEEKAAAQRKITKTSAAPKMDLTGLRWDGRRGKWVPDTTPERTMPIEHAAKPARAAPVVKPNGTDGVKRGAKLETMLGLLQRPEGVTVAELGKECGWLPHTASARISEVRKLYTIATEREEPRGLVNRILERKDPA